MNHKELSFRSECEDRLSLMRKRIKTLRVLKIVLISEPKHRQTFFALLSLTESNNFSAQLVQALIHRPCIVEPTKRLSEWRTQSSLSLNTISKKFVARNRTLRRLYRTHSPSKKEEIFISNVSWSQSTTRQCVSSGSRTDVRSLSAHVSVPTTTSASSPLTSSTRQRWMSANTLCAQPINWDRRIPRLVSASLENETWSPKHKTKCPWSTFSSWRTLHVVIVTHRKM